MADSAFAHVASDPDLAGALLATSGAEAGALRAMAETPAFAVFILDFLLEDDRRVLDFAAAAGVPPQSVLEARMVLQGPTDWA